MPPTFAIILSVRGPLIPRSAFFRFNLSAGRLTPASEFPRIRLTDLPPFPQIFFLMKNELFRMKIASKRQVTVPQRLLDVLGVSEGDEIQIETHGPDHISVHGCKSVRTTMLPEELRKKLLERADMALEEQDATHLPARELLETARRPQTMHASHNKQHG